jgi:[acyl-carrier-protein] S-malonyltransferase
MARALYEESAEVRGLFERAGQALGYDVAALCFEGPKEELNRTERTQPCLLLAGMSAFTVLEAEGVKADVMAGHSLGEYTALTAAGALTLEDAVKLTEQRGSIMQEAVPVGAGKMAAVLGLDRAQVDEACAGVGSGYVSSANYNCPGQVVISGEAAAVDEAIARVREAGAKRAVALAVSVPSHSRLMDSAAEELGKRLDEVQMGAPSVPVVANATAGMLTEPSAIRDALVRQLNGPVLWEDSVLAMGNSGVDTFIEVGPKKVLAGLIKRIDDSARVLNVEDPESLEKTLSELKG